MNKISLTDEEIEELDINLKVSILAHHALAVKNGRDPTLETSDELFERRKVAKVQLKKLVDNIRADDSFNGDYCDGAGDWCVTFSRELWQALLGEIE
uniref:Uncharacterized protein n=1 Tax=viral metagenome TaxID=1070528 RepID=A0A6M3JIH8_9ZZZZ